MTALDAIELERRLFLGEEIGDEELRLLEPDLRPVGLAIRWKGRLRQAVDAWAAVCGTQNFQDSESFDLLVRLCRKAEYEAPLPAAYRTLGLYALECGRYAEALRFLHEAIQTGVLAARRPEAYHRECFQYWHDDEIDAALQRIGESVTPPAPNLSVSASRRVAIVTSALGADNATTYMVERYAKGLTARGAEVRIISTEWWAAAESHAVVRRIEEVAAGIFRAGHADRIQSVRDIIAHLEQNPVDAVLFVIWPIDTVGKVLSVPRLAPRQVFMNSTCEHSCGTFDLALYDMSPRELLTARMKCERRFIPTMTSAPERVENAAPFARTDFGLEPNDVVLGTYGRTSKCTDWPYIRTMARILRSAPQARLLIAGPDHGWHLVEAGFKAHGVAQQVVYGGNFPDAYYGIYKMTDVYCDTLFFRGAQSVLEAMLAGVPVVAMQSTPDPLLDPTGAGPMSNSASLLPADAVTAPPHDEDEYVRIALEYINDVRARKAAGASAQAQARTYDGRAHVDAVFAALFERPK